MSVALGGEGSMPGSLRSALGETGQYVSRQVCPCSGLCRGRAGTSGLGAEVSEAGDVGLRLIPQGPGNACHIPGKAETSPGERFN